MRTENDLSFAIKLIFLSYLIVNKVKFIDKNESVCKRVVVQSNYI